MMFSDSLKKTVSQFLEMLLERAARSVATALIASCFFLIIHGPAQPLTGAENVGADDIGAKASVSLYYEGEPFCGGVVFQDRYILTAAHCFTDEHGNIEKDPEDIEVHYWASGKRDVRKVEQFVVHDNYLFQEARTYEGAQAWDYDNFPVNHEDIALLKIAGTHPAGAASAFVPDINNEYSGTGESVWFFAYGASVNGKIGQLQRAAIGQYSPLEQIIPGKPIEVLYFVRQMIVITSKFNEKVSQCKGDSGSGVFLARSDDIPYDDEPEKLPDALRLKDGHPMLVGLASHHPIDNLQQKNARCGLFVKANGFSATRVDYYHDWILSKMREMQ